MSLLLDALRRAGNETAAAGPSRPADDTAARSDAGAATATAVFNSSEGVRRAERRRYFLIALAALLAAAMAAGAGWFYWQNLQSHVARDLPDYPPAQESADNAASVAGGNGSEDAQASDAAVSDAAAERVFDEWQDTATAIAAADSSADTAGDEAPDAADDAASSTSAAADDDAASSASTADTAEADAAAETASATSNDAAGSAPDSAAADGDDVATDDEPDVTADDKSTDTDTSVDTGGSAMDGAIVERSEDEPSELAQLLQRGYSALRRGDYRAAGRAYAEAVDIAPDNRDARLGAAAVAHQRGDLASARTHYAQILADDPDDPHAQSGLLAIDGVSDPRRAESELKGLLQDHPDSHAVQFALGNLYAAEARWGEAQRAYFEAYRGDPDNANYAFNLAVALDHLDQHDAAHSHYADALKRARSGGAAFSRAAARQRMEQLGDRNGR